MLFPTQHWVVMGLSETGAYNEEDFFEMTAQKTYADKTAFLNEKLWRRVAEKSPGDWVAFLWMKVRATWSRFDGYVGYTPPAGQFMNKNLAPAMYLLMLAAAVTRLRRPRVDGVFFCALVLLGQYLFLLVYEVGNRVVLPYLMLAGLVAAAGAKTLISAAKALQTRRKGRAADKPG